MVGSRKLVGIVALLVFLLVVPARANSISAHHSSTHFVGVNGGANSHGIHVRFIPGRPLGGSILHANQSKLIQHWTNQTGNSPRLVTLQIKGRGHAYGRDHKRYVSVPEGGGFSYLVISGLVMFGSMLLAYRQSQGATKT